MKAKTIPNAPAAVLSEERVQQLLKRLCEIYTRNLRTNETGGALLARHGLTDYAAFERFQVGYSDGRLSQMLPGGRESRLELIALGIMTPKGTERFARRVVFSLIAADGRCMNLWGWSPESPARFLVTRPVGIWNVIAGRQAATLHLTSDPVEALSLIAAGFANSVALMPKLGEPDLGALRAFGVQGLHIVTGDTPSAQINVRLLKSRFSGWPCEVSTLPGCASVNDFLRRHGPKKLSEALVAATHGLPALTVPGMQPLAGGFTLILENRRYEVRGLHKSGNQLRATFRIERADKWYVDTFDLNVARSRREFTREVVRLFEAPLDLIEADLGKLMSACEVRAAQPDLTLPTDTVEAMPEADRKEAEAMGRDPKLIATILTDFETLGVVGESLNKLLCYLAMTSRKQKHPVSVMFVSSSGAGKNTIADAARDLCPPEERVEATNLSGKALYHMGAQSLKHKLLAVDEREGARDADYSLRVLISAGKLTTRVATKDPMSGKLRTDTNHVEGPVAVLITTTDPDTDAETKSRFIVSSIDESLEQTRAIHEYQRRQHTIDGLTAEKSQSAVLRRHHAFQRLLQPMQVVFPDPARVSEVDDRLTSRREFPKMLRLVQTIAFLRQLQKPVKQHGGLNYIEVDDADLQIAAPLIQKLFGSRWRELSQPSQDLLRKLVELRATAGKLTTPTEPFTFSRRQAREFTGLPNTTLHRYLTELLEFEYLLRDKSAHGPQHRYRLDWEDTLPSPGSARLPHNHSNHSGSVPPGRGVTIGHRSTL